MIIKRIPVDPDVFIIDPVVHAFNNHRSNCVSHYGVGMHEMAYGLHCGWNPADVLLPAELYLTDTTVDAAIATVFLESQTHLAAMHTLTLNSWFADGLCSEEKTVEAVTRWPDRVLSYVGVDPTTGLSASIDAMDRQLERTPHAIGLKMYPHQMDPYRRWRADDPEILKLFEAAEARGLKTVAIHKALPNGSVPLAPYMVDDLDVAPDAFPNLSFEIIHAGMAFLEETVWAVTRFPNVYANLETTMGMMFRAPRMFEEIIANFLFWAGPQKLIYSSGSVLSHPQPLLEAFWGFQFSPDILEKFNIPQIDQAAKRAILGENYARATGLDIADRRARIAGDIFARTIAEKGLRAPYETWRSGKRIEA
jgi:uncharacterized protein